MRISDWSSDVCSSDLELNGKPMAGLAVQLTPGANALSTAEGIRTQMAELSKGFPPGVTWSIPYDTTPFISLSIEEVVGSEARRVGKVCVSTCISRWAPDLKKKQTKETKGYRHK